MIPAAAAMAFLGGATAGGTGGLPPVGWSQGPSLPLGFGSRWDYSVAYFPPTDEVVVFGGAPDQVTDSWKNDTWLYSVATDSWTRGPAAPPALTARGGAAMAYDPDLGKIVLFGGAGTDWPPYGDTWLYDGSGWTQGPSAPPAMGGRVGAGMVYDDAIGELVLFSGSGTKAYNDTWLFNGTGWTAGPASPAGLKPRVYFGMTFDPSIGKIIVAGGDGDIDLWYFDGTAWTAGPPLPPEVGPYERLRIAYDPQLSGDFFFGAMGPSGARGDGRIFRPATGIWTWINPGISKPTSRMDAANVWVPTKDALMSIGGQSDQNDGTPLMELWFFRDVPPKVSSLTITPDNPDMTMAVTMVPGPTIGGYGSLSSERQWYVNGVAVPGGVNPTLLPQYFHGDQIQATWRIHDSVGVYGPWVSSPVVTVVDRPPAIKTLSFTPPSPVLTDTVAANVTSTDPDGDSVTYDYAWTVNDVAVGGDNPTLPPSYFQAGDRLGLTVIPTDSYGLTGQAMAAIPVVVGYNLTVDPAIPGGNPRTQGKGYTPNETVDIRIDSPTSDILGSWAADATGKWGWKNVRLPSPLPGGAHIMYGTGRSSHKVGQGTVQILPGATISPTKFAAGATVTFSGVGFVPGELVAVSFPDLPPTTVVADPNGNAPVTLVSPPEPNTGGTIIGTAPSGTVPLPFTVTPVLNVPASGVPGGSATVSVTGFGVWETVNFSLDAGGTMASATTDASGSLSATVPLTGYFGPHTLVAKGVTTGISVSKSLPLPATLTLSPTSGPRGTVVTIASGPGWIPNSKLTFKVGTRTLLARTADGSGSVNFTYRISTKDPLGAVTIKLYSRDLNQTASGTFTVTG